MEAIQTLLNDVHVVQSPSFVDGRGGFMKLFNSASPLLQIYHIQQVNFVQNRHCNTLRGLHYQTGEWAESKFFRVLRGHIQLAFIDLRQGDYRPQYAETIMLNRPDVGVLIPRGFATGYLTLADHTDVLYYSDNSYHPAAEQGIRWNDPAFDIPWQTTHPDLSDKDAAWDNVPTT